MSATASSIRSSRPRTSGRGRASASRSRTASSRRTADASKSRAHTARARRSASCCRRTRSRLTGSLAGADSIPVEVDYRQFPILVVDDEQDILSTFRYSYGDEFEVLTAESAARALDILSTFDPAVIVADPRMPAMTGTEVLVRSMNIRPDAVRIILTRYTANDALVPAVNNS